MADTRESLESCGRCLVLEVPSTTGSESWFYVIRRWFMEQGRECGWVFERPRLNQPVLIHRTILEGSSKMYLVLEFPQGERDLMLLTKLRWTGRHD